MRIAETDTLSDGPAGAMTAAEPIHAARSAPAAKPPKDGDLAPHGPRTRSGNAKVFALLVILATLAPIGLGFNVGKFAPSFRRSAGRS